MKETVGFIGLGGMGLPMATNLRKAGFGLRVYNRTAEKARPLLEQGAMLARSPAETSSQGAWQMAAMGLPAPCIARRNSCTSGTIRIESAFTVPPGR